MKKDIYSNMKDSDAL